MAKQLNATGLLLLLILAACSSAQAAPGNLQPTTIPLPGGSGGLGFDDLGYTAQLGQVLVPAGRTGSLDMVDPITLGITTITGFSSQDSFSGGHDVGITSADAGRAGVFGKDPESIHGEGC